MKASQGFYYSGFITQTNKQTKWSEKSRGFTVRVLFNQTNKTNKSALGGADFEIIPRILREVVNRERLLDCAVRMFVCLFVVIKPETLYFAPCVWREVITPGNGCTRTQAQTTCVQFIHCLYYCDKYFSKNIYSSVQSKK